MFLVGERLVCTCPDCRAEFVVKTKPAFEKQHLRCACGSDFKKVYHSPVLTQYGTASEAARLNLHFTEIFNRLQDHKRLTASTFDELTAFGPTWEEES
jgi:transposase-like protein